MNKNNENLYRINNYIEDNITYTTDYQDCLNELKCFANFLENQEIILNEQLLNTIIRNEKINIILEVIVTNLKNYSLDYKYLNEIFNNKNLTYMIYAFALNNKKENKRKMKSDINDYGVMNTLSTEEFNYYYNRYKSGDEKAKDIIIEHNLRLAISFANKYKGNGIEFEDLVQDAITGLLTALDKYNDDLGVKFSSYASWWIKSRILEDIRNNGTIIHIPRNMYGEILRFVKKYVIENGKKPTIKEISEKLKIEEEKITALLNAKLGIHSIDEPVGNDKEKKVIDEIADNYNIAEEYEKKELKEKLQEIIENVLTEKEMDILIKRYGLNGNEPKTLNEISIEYNLSRERIRQIEVECLTKLAKSSKIGDILEYLNIRNGKVSELKSKIDKRSYYLQELRKTDLKEEAKSIGKNRNVIVQDTPPKETEIEKHYNSRQTYNRIRIISKNNLLKKIKAIKNTPLFKKKVKIYGYDNAIILYLYNGYIDGIHYSNFEIEKLLNIPISTINEFIEEIDKNSKTKKLTK